MNQEKDAINKFNENTESLSNVLLEFSKFCSDNEYFVWGNSARFDIGILQNSYNKLNISIPWNFRKELDVRTLVFFKPDIKENWEFKGIHHNSLDDCINQIGYCCEIYKLIKNENII